MMAKMDYRSVDSDFIEKFRAIVGEQNVSIDSESMADYSHDEFSLENIRRLPEAVVKPRTAEEVSQLVRLCNEERIPLTPRGGGTGLCGGCVPLHGGVLMSFDNMVRILEVDTENLMAVVESGVRLADFYRAIEGEGLFFPPHPGDESATVGGLIATNAGGARAVKYGVIRNFVRGMEVVLPDGEIIMLGGKFCKSSSGYNLMHLMIGSEGTLGIVTKAVISLMPPPQVMYTLVASYGHLSDAISTVPAILKNKIVPMAIEFVEQTTMTLSARCLGTTWPFSEGNAHLIMMIDGSRFEEVACLAESIHTICLEHNALDVLVADTPARQREILKIRSSIYEAMKEHMLEILDIAVPPADIARFVDDVNGVAVKHETWLPTYGHAADGNVHVHIMRSRWEDGAWIEIEGWKEKYAIIRNDLHDLGKKYSGICSGEHGIGLVKKAYLADFLGERQIALMRAIKGCFDPNCILNPGKIFD
jgi:glycolate oxidase